MFNSLLTKGAVQILGVMREEFIMRFTDDEIRQHFVLAEVSGTRYLGYVCPGSFASNAWVDEEPYRCMTPRVEAIFSDDGQRASTSRDNLTRITSAEKLTSLLSDPSIKMGELFREWVLQETEEFPVLETDFGLCRV